MLLFDNDISDEISNGCYNANDNAKNNVSDNNDNENICKRNSGGKNEIHVKLVKLKRLYC